MALTLNFKDGIDLPSWRNVSPKSYSSNNAWSNGEVLTYDTRGRKYAHPEMFLFSSTTSLLSYNPITDGWAQKAILSLTGAFAFGSETIFVPSQGFHASTVAAGTTSTIINTSGVLQNSASVVENQLANRGDGLGFLVRIVGKTSGKIEERRIIGNTSGTTPTLYLDQALSFTPAVGDVIEYLAGRIYFMVSGTIAAGSFKYYDVLTGTSSSNLVTTNLPGTITSSNNNNFLTLDESHVPYNRYPGEGFVVGSSLYDNGTITPTDYSKKCLLATATAAGTITGQATGGDATVLANEYRNFQIRIVEDTTTPASVGQRRKITSHTAGASAVYTLASNWTTTPSSTCKFVIENDNDKLLFFASGNTVVYNYNHAANTWDTTTWSSRSIAHTAGFVYQSYGVDVANNTANKQVRNSHIISPRGSNALTYDILDIAGGTTGAWTSGKTFTGLSLSTFLASGTSQNSSWAYVPNANQGRYVYIQIPIAVSTVGYYQVYRLDLYTKNIEIYTSMPAQYGVLTNNSSFTVLSNTTYSGGGSKSGMYLHVDSSGSVLATLYFGRPHCNTGDWYQLLITR